MLLEMCLSENEPINPEEMIVREKSYKKFIGEKHYVSEALFSSVPNSKTVSRIEALNFKHFRYYYY